MQYRKIGNSDLSLSEITFGAWAAGGWMWGGTERNEAINAIQRSFDAGVTSIDTAPVYGQGLSEEIVGETIKNIPRDQVQILTKYGMRWDTTQGTLAMHSKDNSGKPIDIYKFAGKASIIKECEDSLQRLGTDYIDLYQIHWPDASTPIQETMEAVTQLIQQGKVRYAGVCNYDRSLLEASRPYINLISDQIPYSMVNRGIEKDTIPYCIENNLGILAYSPLERGLLTGKMKPGYVFAADDHRKNLKHFSNDHLQQVALFLQHIQPIAGAHQASISQIVLRWTLEQPGITIALAGARNAAQALQNAAAGNIVLSEDELKSITLHLDNLIFIR
jgi:aryl-alcohol dehydrogenase-like predicted oxidoreductase